MLISAKLILCYTIQKVRLKQIINFKLSIVADQGILFKK